MALHTRCLRFVRNMRQGTQRTRMAPRKTRFRLLARLYRVGLVTHWVPLKGL
jgi:hypothetical protein